VPGLGAALHLPVRGHNGPGRLRYAPPGSATRTRRAKARDAAQRGALQREGKRDERRSARTRKTSHAGGAPTPSRGGQTGSDSTRRGSGGVGIGFPPRDLEIWRAGFRQLTKPGFVNLIEISVTKPC
jgi:hypothetical protein